jgi:hypothetical protein
MRRPRAAMLLWGLAIGLMGVLALLALMPLEWRVVGRDYELRDAMIVLNHGGPLLLGRSGANGSLYIVGAYDDEGIFIYVPLLSRLFGGVDPVMMLRYLYVALVGFTTAIYPSVFYKLTRSLLAGFLAPVMFLVCIQSMSTLEIYWLPAWGALTLLPLIFLLARDWPRLGLLMLGAVALAAGWLSSIRNGSGLGILIAAALVVLLRRSRWWRALGALALLVVVYLSINTLLPAAVRENRNHWLGAQTLADEQSTSHPLWLAAYVGLGYLPNTYGIRYDDEVNVALAQREAPGTTPGSSNYIAVIRGAYLRFVNEHPLEVAKQYGAKAIVTTADASPYLLIVLVTMPAMLLLGPERRIRRRWALLTLPMLILTFGSTVIAIPNGAYEEGLYGTLGALGILGACSALAAVEAASRRRGGLRPGFAELTSAIGRAGQLRRSMRLSATALAALVLVMLGAHFIRTSAERWQGFSSGVLIERLEG